MTTTPRVASTVAAFTLIAATSFLAGRCTVTAETLTETFQVAHGIDLHAEGVDIALSALTTTTTSTTTTTTPRHHDTTKPGADRWDRLAQCESSGNWEKNSGNGYFGGLQFTHQTWLGYHGDEFAWYPHEATKEQQITVAERLYAKRGWQPWPACTRKLGWR